MSFELSPSTRCLHGESRELAGASKSGSPESNSGAPASRFGSPRCSEVEVLSTHDQLLGGPSGKIYLGCQFPADPAYAAAITEMASRWGSGSRGRAWWAGSRSISSRPQRRQLATIRDRDQLAQGRNHRPVPHPRVPDGEPYDPESAAPVAERPGEVPRRHRPSRVRVFRVSPGTTSSTSLCAGTAVRPCLPEGRDLSHDERAQRAWPNRADRVGDWPEEAMGMYGDAEAALLDAGRSALVPPSLPGG